MATPTKIFVELRVFHCYKCSKWFEYTNEYPERKTFTDIRSIDGKFYDHDEYCCPECGGEMRYERSDPVLETDRTIRLCPHCFRENCNCGFMERK